MSYKNVCTKKGGGMSYISKKNKVMLAIYIWIKNQGGKCYEEVLFFKKYV